jgi:hypothetical protein
MYKFMNNEYPCYKLYVEEFIDGREFTCMVTDNPEDMDSPIAYAPIECVLPSKESFKHY